MDYFECNTAFVFIIHYYSSIHDDTRNNDNEQEALGTSIEGETIMTIFEHHRATSPQEQDAAVKVYTEQFHTDGFVAIRNFLPKETLCDWQTFSPSFFHQTFTELYDHGQTEFPTHALLQNNGDCELSYALGLGVKHGFREIVMRSPGRYELSLLHENDERIPMIEEIKQRLAPIACSIFQVDQWEPAIKICNLSLVISTPGSPAQSWHADGGHIDLHQHLQCHCMNVFIPLSDITYEMGPTEIRPRTHFYTRNLAPMMLVAKARKELRNPVTPILQTGDILVFDYRVLHRGLANTSNRDRIMLVITLSKSWFNDTLNFPSRSFRDTRRIETHDDKNKNTNT